MPSSANDHGPFETEGQALDTPAVRAVYGAYEAGITSLRDGAADLLLSACERAGVTLGAYDRRILVWLAAGDRSPPGGPGCQPHHSRWPRSCSNDG